MLIIVICKYLILWDKVNNVNLPVLFKSFKGTRDVCDSKTIYFEGTRDVCDSKIIYFDEMMDLY